MVALLPIELENKLKERTQMFRNVSKFGLPESFFLRQQLEDKVGFERVGSVTPWLGYVS